MYLAKRKDGTIGRVTRQMGEKAVIAPMVKADRTGSVLVSSRSVLEDEKYFASMNAKKAAQERAKRISQQVRAQNQRMGEAYRRLQVENSQSRKLVDPTQEKLKRYFSRQMGQTESEKTICSITTPGTVSNNPTFPDAIRRKAGFNLNESVPDDCYTKIIAQRADYMQNLPANNPLTADGTFGPSTDWDRFVFGKPYGNVEVTYAGGTMVRQSQPGEFGHGLHGRSMGDDTTDWDTAQWEDIPDTTVTEDTGPSWWDNLVSGAGQALETAAPKILTNVLAPGQKAPATTVKTVTVPGSALSTKAAAAGVPMWAVYAGIGLVGVGVLAMVLKKK